MVEYGLMVALVALVVATAAEGRAWHWDQHSLFPTTAVTALGLAG